LKSHKKCKIKENAKNYARFMGVGKVQRDAMIDGLSFPI
jgi:hypothetical protein